MNVFNLSVDTETHPAPTLLRFPSDLRVLGKGDFRQLIKWRLRLVKYRDELRELEAAGKGAEEDGTGEEETTDVPMTEEEKEDEVQAEIRALQ